MDSVTIRTLAEHIAQQHRCDRDHNRTGQQPSFDTTTENDSDWDKRNSSGDGGRSKDQPG